jgi:hypothetical protein
MNDYNSIKENKIMKKKLLLTLSIFCIALPMFSQVMFDFEINIENKIKDGIKSGDVMVILKSDNGQVNYQIMPLGQLDGTPVAQSGTTKKKKYTFKNIPSGKYLIKITDEESHMAFKLLVVNEE